MQTPGALRLLGRDRQPKIGLRARREQSAPSPSRRPDVAPMQQLLSE